MKLVAIFLETLWKLRCIYFTTLLLLFLLQMASQFYSVYNPLSNSLIHFISWIAGMRSHELKNYFWLVHTSELSNNLTSRKIKPSINLNKFFNFVTAYSHLLNKFVKGDFTFFALQFACYTGVLASKVIQYAHKLMEKTSDRKITQRLSQKLRKHPRWRALQQ